MKEIEDVFNHPDVIGVCKSIGGAEWEDIRQDVFLKLLEMSDEDLGQIRNLTAFVVRMCYNKAQDFCKKKKPDLVPNFDERESIDNEDTNVREKVLGDCLSPNRFYHARIFVYSNMFGSVMAFSRATKIPYRELNKSYNEYKLYLQNWLKK